MAVDQETYSQFLVAEKRARDLGLSLVEVLDRAGLLLTQQRRHNLTVQAVEDTYRRYERQAPHKLMSYYLHRPDGSSAEMFEAVRIWLEIVCRNMANKTLEDL